MTSIAYEIDSACENICQDSYSVISKCKQYGGLYLEFSQILIDKHYVSLHEGLRVHLWRPLKRGLFATLLATNEVSQCTIPITQPATAIQGQL
jgi:hypothetical protein